MKRIIFCLLISMLLLSSCTLPADPLKEAASPLAEGYDALPDAHAPASLKTTETAALFFRYLDEPFLASEERILSLAADQPLEKAVINALLAGPDVQSSELSALFPPGVKVRSTVRQGRTLFVTFSPELMNAYPDEPQNWQDDPYWALEAPLRRKLCMQSLVASLTENCDVDRVQVLVEHSGQALTDSLRLRQRYFLTGDQQALAEPLQRDDSLLLSPSVTLDTILSLWQSRSWTRLKHYTFPADADLLPENLPHLLDYGFTGFTLSGSGQTATFTLHARLRRDGTEENVSGRIIRLTHENGLWRISMEQLTGWLEAKQ